MKKHKIARLAIPGVAAMLLGTTACNSSSDPTVDAYGEDTSVAVTAFKLKLTTTSINNVDSVFFSIDLENAVIFNADSLPKGSVVTDLIPVITYPETVSEAIITMNGEKRQGEVDYKTNPSDTIDFSGPVTLAITAQDGKTKRTYDIRVNVHKMNSDSLTWDNLAAAKLPSRLGTPRNQKSVQRDSRVYTLIEENNGTFTLASSSAPGSQGWSKTEVDFGNTVDVRSFATSDDSFYILTTDGTLLSSSDGTQWSSTGRSWVSILGGYDSDILGIASTNGKLQHVSYPTQYPTTEVAADFPVGGMSNMGLVQTKWSITPIVIIAGGYTTEGKATPCVWGFDGTSWARISQDGTPALAEATLIPYTYFRHNSVNSTTTEYSVWLLMGGLTIDGEINRTVYLSYDNGVNWQKAVDYMQLPESIPSLYGMDAVVLSERKEASLTDYWTRMPARRTPMRVTVEQDGYNIYWDVPFIYLCGGYTTNGILNDAIWRGVLNRLTFTPLI